MNKRILSFKIYVQWLWITDAILFQVKYKTHKKYQKWNICKKNSWE